MSNKDNATGFGIGFLVGAAVGLAIGILYAPRPGRETRELIREKAAGARDKAEQFIEKVKPKVARPQGGEQPTASEPGSTG